MRCAARAAHSSWTADGSVGPAVGHEVTGRKAKGDGGDASVSPRVSARSGSLLGNRTARDALSRTVGRSRSGSKIQEVCMARPCTAT